MLSRTATSLFIFLAGLSPWACSWASPFPDRYDDEIRDAAERFVPGWDWRTYKAQLYQESQLKPGVESPVGAKGIAQFMPGTWREAKRHFGWGTISPHAVGPAIKAGAWYDGRLYGAWTAPRPHADRISLTLASYNAGLGNLLNAQRKAGGANEFAPIMGALPEVTGRHASETRTYVDRIWGYRTRMILGY